MNGDQVRVINLALLESLENITSPVAMRIALDVLMSIPAPRARVDTKRHSYFWSSKSDFITRQALFWSGVKTDLSVTENRHVLQTSPSKDSLSATTAPVR